MKPKELDSLLKDLQHKVDTSPLKGGGASFKTNVLIEESSSKLYYKPSIGVGFFSFIFLAAGLGILFLAINPLFKNNFNFAEVEWFLLLFGLVFASAGGFMFYFFYMPRVFDKQLGVYYKAYKPNIHRIKKDASNKYIPLISIVAIQIIGEHIKSNKGSYKSFELNLILQNGSRKNVIDHGNLKSIIIDAEILSDFLNVPIWHAGSIN
ncbi:hypothetical protein HNV10_04390 [Winogradskyella litoriviva]|uniref:Uncharacterized protein n=1 Tax=Winogradskyella litoriviva TaxID=1220182 RepID=A0ABX2E419_9FLAO|nr:hypothetical protein [Winogradskyella litoriviva]NRD22466.1 hypothetical protein [Winogradskyella litoriviva]